MHDINDSPAGKISMVGRIKREQVLERMFKEHGMALRSYLRVRASSEADLDDIIQEVFLKLARMEDLLEKLNPTKGSNRSFLLTVANNIAVDLQRRKAVRDRYYANNKDLQLQEVNEATPERQVSNTQELDKVRVAILNLRPEYRCAFLFSRFEHKSYFEIAEQMGVSVKQVEKYISSALFTLRAQRRQNREAG